jgi:hypothetical protein
VWRLISKPLRIT